MKSRPFSELGGALLVLAIASGLACTTTSVVRPDQLQRLDGFGAGGPGSPEPELETISGYKVAVGPDARLTLELPGARVGGQFDEIHVRDGVLSGKLREGIVVEAPLAQVTRATIEKTDKAATAVAFGGILLVLLAGFYVAVSASGQQSTPGRPLRVRGDVVRADLVTAPGWQRDGSRPDMRALSVPAREALAVAWADVARSEHASVPAFSRLALTLMGMGAPARLVEAAHRAALEEIEHARLAFALAEAYAGTPVAPASLVELRAAPAVTATSLAELAHESLLDGCLNEGINAEVARQASLRAGDPVVRAALQTIARDEWSHAELAWQIVAWCCDQDGAAIERGLRKAIHRSRLAAAPESVPEHVQGEVAAHGWLGSAAWNDIAERTQLAVASRLASLHVQRRSA